jgi:hypothetical protein
MEGEVRVEEPSGAEVTLTEVDSPPSAPPSVLIEDIAMPVLATEWYDPVGRSLREVQPGDERQPFEDLPSVDLASGRVDFVVRSSATPQRVEVRLFDRIVSGVPEGRSDVAVCAGDCAVSPAEDQHFVIDVPSTTKAIVLLLIYAVPLEPDGAPAGAPMFNHASYGARAAGAS